MGWNTLAGATKRRGLRKDQGGWGESQRQEDAEEAVKRQPYEVDSPPFERISASFPWRSLSNHDDYDTLEVMDKQWRMLGNFTTKILLRVA